MPKTSLRTPADIVAAAAALLGFAPTNSVVVYMLHRDPTDELIVRCAIRFDITVTADQAANFPATCNLRPATTTPRSCSPCATSDSTSMPTPSWTPCATL